MLSKSSSGIEKSYNFVYNERAKYVITFPILTYEGHDPKRGLQRWNFPFKPLEIAKLYLRTADYSMKKPCGIYEMKSENGRPSYKIFADSDALQLYLKKNKEKNCKTMTPIFIVEEYKEYY